MKILTSMELEDLFRSWGVNYDVRVPIRLPDGTRAWGRITEGPLSLSGGPVLSKPTAFFFPQSEAGLEYLEPGKIKLPDRPLRPLLLAGLTAQDAESIAFVDEFFGSHYQDDLYFRRREGAVIIVLSGRCGKDGQPLKRATGSCDMELVCDGESFIVVPHSDKGRELSLSIQGGREGGDVSHHLVALEEEASRLMAEEEESLRSASRLLLAEKVPDSFWEEFSKSCIACTACNLVCPTCTCFEIYDQRRDGTIERRRLWDSCQLEGFAREASGHNPLASEASRTRRRIHHKLASDVIRWGRITCFLCGRCDLVCPTHLGIKALSREMVRRYGP